MNFPWRTALFVSVAVNLVLISAALGAFASGARLSRPANLEVAADGPFLTGQRAFMQALSPEARRTLRRELAGELIAMREERAASRAARRALYEAARAEPYDPARVRAAFAEVRAADAVLLAGFHDGLAEGLSRMDASDRAAALDALQRGRAPAEDAAPTVESDGAGETAPTRQERRERLRERWRERREQRQQQ